MQGQRWYWHWRDITYSGSESRELGSQLVLALNLDTFTCLYPGHLLRTVDLNTVQGTQTPRLGLYRLHTADIRSVRPHHYTTRLPPPPCLDS